MDIEALLYKSSEQGNEEITNQIHNVLKDPQSTFLFIHLLIATKNSVVLNACLLYIHKSLENHWVNYEFDQRGEIRHEFLEFLKSIRSDIILTKFLDNIVYVYSRDETDWPELMNYMIDIISNSTSVFYGVSILKSILPHMKHDKIDEFYEFIIDIIKQNFKSGNEQLVALSSDIFLVLVQKCDLSIEENEELIDIVASFIHISKETRVFKESEFIMFWSSISSLNSVQFFIDEYLNELVESSIFIVNDKNNGLFKRTFVLESLYPLIPMIPDYIESVLSLCMDLTAGLIENDGIIPADSLSHFESAIYHFPREEIYPLIQSCVGLALNAEDVPHQTSGLLLFRVIISVAPDCAQKDIESIITLIETALNSEESLLKQAACNVLEVFNVGFSSLNCYGPKFLPSTVPLLVSESPEIRVGAYKAVTSLLERVDATIENLFPSLVQILNDVPEDDLPNFIRIVTRAVDISEDFDDEQCDGAIEIIRKVLETNSIEMIAAAFQMGISLLKQDEAHLETVCELLLGSVDSCLDIQNFEYVASIVESINFVGDLALHLKDSADSIISQFVSKIFSHLKNENKAISQRSLVSMAKILRTCPNHHQEYLSDFVSSLDNALKSEKKSSQESAIEAINIIRRSLDEETKRLFYERMLEIINTETTRLLLISSSFLAASKLIKSSKSENKSYYIDIGRNTVNKIISTEIPFLEGKELRISGASSFLFANLCRYLSSLLVNGLDEADEICSFLLPWFQNESELEHFSVTGTLISAMQTNSISQVIRQTILESIINEISFASDPSLQQNIVFFLNLLVQNDDSFIAPVCEILSSIEKWRHNAKEAKFGYQDVLSNIASLYLTIAAKVPDFDQSKLVYAFAEFPPFDVSECSSMISSILKLYNSQKIQSDFSTNALGVAIARYIAWDDSMFEKAHISEPQHEEIISIFRSICAKDESLLKTLERMYAKTRGKFKRIANVLQ